MTSKEELQAVLDLRVYLARIQYYMQSPQLQAFLNALGVLFNVAPTNVMMVNPNEVSVMVSKEDYDMITEEGEDLFIPTMYDRASQAALQLFKNDNNFINICNEIHPELFNTIISNQSRYLGALFQVVVAPPVPDNSIQVILIV